MRRFLWTAMSKFYQIDFYIIYDVYYSNDTEKISKAGGQDFLL